ncbi:hypothetical protein V8B55DRAFT_1370793 [Mucor lusitanicus]|uniref:F-box domain-containing protein n=2 Tax=Mucor circinelloides f. lusitanicus TaxID=29924 RepID=A0A162YCD9_MUCCL|nr:hypothetical protein MUCCIDRAFT_115707 [Mucor lusitanicus CBS 277.49]
MTLPSELWMNVFSCVLTVKELAQCRLVCRTWDPIAERAMFNRQLVIKDGRQFADRLCYHLQRKSALIRLIKHIDVNPNEYYEEVSLDRRLLKMIITPDLETISGAGISEADAQFFMDLFLSSGRNFNKIKAIPICHGSEGVFSRLQYVLRGSLETLSVSISSGEPNEFILRHLYEFQKLKSFNLHWFGQTMAIKELENTLQKVQTAHDLWLNAGSVVMDFRNDAQREAWLHSSVQRNTRVDTLRTIVPHQPQDAAFYMKYLTQKYPNLADVSISLRRIANLKAIFPYIDPIQTISSISSAFHESDDLTQIGRLLKSASNSIEILYEPEDLPCTFKASRSKVTNHSEFSLCLASSATHNYIRKLFSSVATSTSNITELTIDLVHCAGKKYKYASPLNLYKTLDYAPHVQKLEFSDRHITFENDSLLPALNDLKNLEFACTKLDTRALSQVGQAAPNLKYLTLASCLVVNERGFYDKISRIVLPGNTLEKVTLRLKEWRWEMLLEDESDNEEYDDFGERIERPEMDELRDINEKLRRKDTTYFHVKTNTAGDQYFLLKPGSPVATFISKENYAQSTERATAFYIECNSLASLSVDLGNICADVRFQSS